MRYAKRLAEEVAANKTESVAFETRASWLSLDPEGGIPWASLSSIAGDDSNIDVIYCYATELEDAYRRGCVFDKPIVIRDTPFPDRGLHTLPDFA